jgi:hypothetical protein
VPACQVGDIPAPSTNILFVALLCLTCLLPHHCVLVEEFQKYFEHISNLSFEDTPDYMYLKSLFKDLFRRRRYEYGSAALFDWEVIVMQQQQQQQQQQDGGSYMPPPPPQLSSSHHQQQQNQHRQQQQRNSRAPQAPSHVPPAAAPGQASQPQQRTLFVVEPSSSKQDRRRHR